MVEGSESSAAAGPQEEARASAERNALLNAIRHSGRAELGAVISKVMGELPELRGSPRAVAEVASEAVKKVNSMSLEAQQTLLDERYPGYLTEHQKKSSGERDSLPPLPHAEKGTVVLRLPPEPSGYMHIGHAMAGMINYLYRDAYTGKLWLRFEDTNPKKVQKAFYESFRAGYGWLGITWDEEKSVSSDIELIYGYGRRLLEMGEAYACSCDAEKVKKLRFEGTPCEHRTQPVERNLSLWDAMLSRRVKQGEVVIRLRGDLKSLDYSLRDPNIFRIIEDEHPLTGKKYSVWPVYDLEVVIEDEICGITHILRSSEFHVGLQDHIRALLSFRPVNVTQFSRFNFKGTPVQKRLLRPLVQEGLVSGWDDPRMPTIDGVKRRGVVPKTIRDFTIQVGYTKSEHEYDWSLLFAVNRKLLDPVSKRLFFVPDPAKLEIEGGRPVDVVIRFHPEKDLGERTIGVENQVYVPSEDLSRIGVGETFRLMDLYNVRLLHEGEDGSARAAYTDETLIRDTRKVQWVTDESLRIRVMEPSELYNEDGTFNTNSLTVRDGLVEESFRETPVGTIVQFPRYGFCRIDSMDTCVLSHR